jgi:photosystem II stability/assembly factor-like uncharacterized protein
MPQASRWPHTIVSTAFALALAGAWFATGGAQGSTIAPDVLSQLRYRYIGPVGNRVTSAAGVPGDPDVYYVGSASGGVWKTTDGGVHWDPVLDDHPVQSIGALAVAPSDPNVVWAGTGEACIRSHISVGNGIYKSMDAGRTWAHMGLDRTGRIGRVVIDPKNPDVVMACALGHAYGPQPERGVFRTTDGGKTWDKVLFVDENTGCSDLAMDPSNPRILFAGMWQLEIRTWGRDSGGPGSGLFTSRDGGLTWTRLTGRGLPARPVGKVTVAMAPSNSNRVYAMIETGDGVPWKGQETDRGTLWRSDDGGESFRVVSHDRNVNGRAHYYSHMDVSPDNENEVYFLTASFSTSMNGGETLAVQGGARSPGGDNHDIWIDPTNPDRMIVANDPGTSISVNRGRTWMRIQLPNAQMYHVTVDNAIPYNVLGNKQDGPSYRGPSNSRSADGGAGGAIPRSMWFGVAGGESGWATPDPANPNLVWSSASGSGSVGGIVVRFDVEKRQGRNVEVWPESTGGHTAADVRYRFNWTMPLTISPHDRNTIYVGSQHVHKTTNGGESWEVISPDLTTNDKSRQGFSGGLTGDNIGVEYAPVVMAIAESRVEKGLIWAGTNDGQVQVTRDAGKSWTNVTAGIPNMPSWGTVGNIEPSRYSAGTAYLTVDAHQVNSRDPFVYKTADYGKTWRAITNGIARNMLSYAHCIREDPVRRGLLYLGLEGALYGSFDDGENWVPLQTNMPHAPVYWLAIQEHFNDLVVATYGRGFWILDDLGPLQQLTPQALASNAHLFAPRVTYRFRAITNNYSQTDDQTAGQNPPYGAIISYYLRSAPAGDVTVRILDASGQAVRTLQGSKHVGINRLSWDLRGEPSTEIRLRTSPAFAPDVRPGPEGWRPLPEGGRLTLMAPPGKYTVELSAGGQRFTQPLTLLKDPNSAGTEADIQAQLTMLRDVRSDLESVAGMVNGIEMVRSQLYGVTQLLEGDRNAAEVRSAADALDKKLIAVEETLIQRRLTGRGQDGVRWPAQLVSKLTYLAGGLAGNDYAPTSQQRDVHKVLEERIAAQQAALKEIMGKDLASFNSLLRELKIQHIITAGSGGRSPSE